MFKFSHYAGHGDDALAVYIDDVQPGPGIPLPPIDDAGPCDRLGQLIRLGDTVQATSPSGIGLHLGDTGSVMHVEDTPGHEGVAVWTIGIRPHDGTAHFHTATLEIYEVI